MPNGSLKTVPDAAGFVVTVSVTGAVTVPLRGKLKLGFALSLLVTANEALSVPAEPRGGAKVTSISFDSCGGIVTTHVSVAVGTQLVPRNAPEPEPDDVTVRIKSSRPLLVKRTA